MYYCALMVQKLGGCTHFDWTSISLNWCFSLVERLIRGFSVVSCCIVVSVTIAVAFSPGTWYEMNV